MRVMTWFVVAALASSSADALAASVSVFPQPLPGQELVYEAGSPRIISRLPDSTVVLEPMAGSAGSRGALGVTVVNFSPDAVTVMEHSLSLTVGAEPVAVEGRAAMLKREKRRQFWEGMAAGLAGAANAYSASQAGQQTAYANYSGTASAYGSGGYARGDYSGTAVVTYTDPVAQQQAHMNAAAQNQVMFDRMQTEQAARASTIQAQAFAAQTIPSGSSYAGLIEYKYPPARRIKGKPLEIAIAVGRDTHRFALGVREPLSGSEVAALQARYPTVQEISAAKAMHAVPVAAASQLNPIAPPSPPAQPLPAAARPVPAARQEQTPRPAPGLAWAEADTGSDVTREFALKVCSRNSMELPTVQDLKQIFRPEQLVGEMRCGGYYCKLAAPIELSGPLIFTNTGTFNLISGAQTKEARASALCVRRG